MPHAKGCACWMGLALSAPGRAQGGQQEWAIGLHAPLGASGHMIIELETIQDLFCVSSHSAAL